MTLLDVQSLTAGYSRKQILNGLSFQIQAHTLVGILGANGSGKTTLLKALCGILPSTGQILLAGDNVCKLSPKALAKRSRYIPQRTGIQIDISVLDVVLMGFNPHLGLLESPTAAMRRAAMDALAQVGLADRSAANFLTLSEGQKQLCLLARAMLPEEGILFLDEPESALDFSGRYHALRLVRHWTQAHEGAALVTLHDPQLALNTCDRLLLLSDGRLLTTLTPAATPPQQLEDALSTLFGPLSIRTCTTRDGKDHFVLLKEE